MTDVTLATAKAHLSELVSRVAQGDSVRITRRGKLVAQLSQVTDRFERATRTDRLHAVAN